MKRILFLLILSIVCVSNGISSNSVTDKRCHNKGEIVFVNKTMGTGRFHKRVPQKPFCSAILIDDCMSFSFFALIDDAKIEITKDDIIVFSKNYSKLEGSLEVQLPELDEGDYVIEITNNDGLELFGNFVIQ